MQFLTFTGITSSDNNTNPNDFMPMANANRTFDDDEDNSDDEPSTLLEFIIVATLPVVIAVVAGVYCLVRYVIKQILTIIYYHLKQKCADSCWC